MGRPPLPRCHSKQPCLHASGQDCLTGDTGPRPSALTSEAGLGAVCAPPTPPQGGPNANAGGDRQCLPEEENSLLRPEGEEQPARQGGWYGVRGQ